MNYNLMPLKYFVDIVQTHGFISAAKRNYVSETAVSSAVSKLEKELGQQLLNRKSGEFSLTKTGEIFYKRAVLILNSYNEIWHHPESSPSQKIRIHFLEGMGKDAAFFAENLKNASLTFDEELFSTSISRLLNNEYDLLIGFNLAFVNNAKVEYLPLRKINFDLLFNQKAVDKYKNNLKELANNSQLYLQNWQSSGISDIQTAMLKKYEKNSWSYKKIISINSFEAACLNVNFSGGISMVPENFDIPENCNNIFRFTPEHLRKKFQIVVAFNKNISPGLKKQVTKAISLSYH